MKGLIGLLFLCFAVNARAQYYYKDILLTRQTIDKWKTFKENRISSVTLTSLESNGTPTEGFECHQTIAADFSTIETYTRSNSSTVSNLVAYYDANGLLKKTIDTSDTYQSTSDYEYDANSRILSITNTSIETDNQIKSVEKHIWKYDQQSLPATMIKIKDDRDTTYVQFIKDEKGNITEERAVRNGNKLPVIYYYYGDDHQLTDIVRYNVKAQRLLPDYIFEYSNGRLSSMIFVPAGSSYYQNWVYQYDEKGLKKRDNCFNKKKELVGKIEYQYTYR
ncbi:MAG: RHS repeat protein [Bacteroidetes bacterium]|nr:RHS repeat protein [Bacteroidota bacterium]